MIDVSVGLKMPYLLLSIMYDVVVRHFVNEKGRPRCNEIRKG